ncbi:MAG: LysM peptidoglycan-binding domain-containing protein [Oscillospiraceae bacterium]
MVYISLGNLILPINPKELFFYLKSGHKDVEVMSLGSVVKLGNSRPIVVKVNSFFSDNDYYFSNNNSINARDAINYLEEAFLNNYIINFSIKGNSVPKSFNVVIDSFSFGERAMENGDVYYNLVLKQYRKSNVKYVDNYPYLQYSHNTNPINTNQSYRTHKVIRGNSLWGLSAKYLGSGSRYMEIANLNNIKNPRLIYVGQVLKIPW